MTAAHGSMHKSHAVDVRSDPGQTKPPAAADFQYRRKSAQSRTFANHQTTFLLCFHRYSIYYSNYYNF